MGTAPFSIVGIDHILLHVNGMNANIAFYEDVLGCIVEARLPKFGMAELAAGRSHVDLVDVACAEGAWAKSSSNGGRNIDHFALAIEPRQLGSLREYLASAGVQIVEEREEDGPQGKTLSLYVRDPSGNTIELIAHPVSP